MIKKGNLSREYCFWEYQYIFLITRPMMSDTSDGGRRARDYEERFCLGLSNMIASKCSMDALIKPHEMSQLTI